MANNTFQDAKNRGQDAASKTADAASNLGHDAAQKAREVGHDAAQKARDVGHDLADAGRSAVNAATKTADNAAARAGDGLDSLGDRVREYGPRSGMMGQATEAVAGGLERGGEYLRDQGLTGMAGDVTEMIKRNPIPALMFGIGLGFILARLTSPRS